jgi:iron(III) transport system permease protein
VTIRTLTTGRVRDGVPVRRRVRRPALAALATGSVAVAAIPLVYLAVRAGESGYDRLAAAVFTARVAGLAGTSLALAAVVTAACLVLGVGSAYLVTRTDLPARRLFGLLAVLPLAVPSYVAAFAWSSIVDGFEGFWAAALVLTLGSYPYVFLPVAAALSGADAAQEEVSRSLGHGPWRTFLGVTARQIRPALAGGALLVALYVLSDFGAVAMLRADTFTRAIFISFEVGFDRTTALMLSCVLVVLALLILGAESATRRRGARYASMSGARRPADRVRLGRLRWPAVLALVVVAAVAVGVTAISLAGRMAAGTSRPGALEEIFAAATASVTVSAMGAALTTALAIPLGLLAARAPGGLSLVLDRVAYLSHGLPGLVIGLSLVFFGINVVYPLYQTTWLLALAYAALFLPLAVAAVTAAAVQAPPALEEVARSLGRRPMVATATVSLPIIAPGVGAGAALVFLTAMKELPATLLLRPTGMDTLATELWTHSTVSAHAAATPYAALIVVFAAIPAWVLAARTGVLTKDHPR